MIAAGLSAFLLDAAIKAGAPIIKGILQKHLGGVAGDLAGTVIDTIAGHAGVTPDELPTLPADQLENAVRAAEDEAPELVLAHVESQRLATQLQIAEMDKDEAAWTWAWRPAWMWLLGFLWLWRLVLVPIADASTGSSIANSIDLTTMGWLTTLFAGFYMGGHTVKDVMTKWLATR